MIRVVVNVKVVEIATWALGIDHAIQKAWHKRKILYSEITY
jgi:hypothetical protein